MADNIRIFEVGGSIRDEMLGIDNPPDRDFCAEAPSWSALLQWCEVNMDRVFLVTPEFFTVRGRIGKDAIDIVMCRIDGASSDGRHPDQVELGTLSDDLARRDFTVNAMAWEVDHKLNRVGELIDPHNGRQDLKNNTLKCVGITQQRLQEDGLRLLRAARFIITKGFLPDEDLKHVLETSTWWSWLEETVSTERIREELQKMFTHDTAATMKFLVWNCSVNAVRKLFDDDIWLKPTMEKK